MSDNMRKMLLKQLTDLIVISPQGGTTTRAQQLAKNLRTNLITRLELKKIKSKFSFQSLDISQFEVGDFSFVDDPDTYLYLHIVYQVVDKLECWEEFNDSKVLTNPIINCIINETEKDDILSFCFEHLEYIKRHGWGQYINEVLTNKINVSLSKRSLNDITKLTVC